ncbi:hypothetical protein PINS_up007983 [Pythium insidiosum]|nr:hypothetical protein PINS_up007983 [Pythium insidiosum]
MEYLHANYRFVVAPLENEDAVACWDVETLTEWKSVEQVLLWYDESSPVTCPICLDSFRAPKITRCGHVFCWPCILRYLSMGDKYWRRCPMCFESVQKGQLKSVRLEQVQLPPRVDTNVTFQFMQRSRASLFPRIRASSLPLAERARMSPHRLPSVYDAEAKFSRILESTNEYLTHLALSELRDLEVLEAECRSCGDMDTLPFVEEAMKATSQRLARHESAQEVRAIVDTAGGGHKAQPKGTSRRKAESSSSDDVYSFYQLANGCYVVLHSLNMKCLLKEFSDRAAMISSESTDVAVDSAEAAWLESATHDRAGSASSTGQPRQTPSSQYSLLPDAIEGRILDVEHHVMDDEAEKRYRFLGHLPRYCDFYVCELDLSDVLSPETINVFRGELKKREKARRAKREAEKKKGQPGEVSSPLFKDYASRYEGFKIAEDGGYWPAPSELSLAEALQESLDLARSESAPFATSPPTSPPMSALFLDADASFARITQESGYFPPLGAGAVSSSASSPPPSVWGMSNPVLGRSQSEPPTNGKKKGAMKKGTQLFSTTQRRSYR